MRRRILLTNVALWTRSGTELFTCELARGCRRRGHEVAVYTRKAGSLADGLRADGVSVCESLEALPWRPEVLHTQHTLEALAAIGRFPDVPATYVCHDARSWIDSAPPLSSIGRYVAVDELCRERVAREAGIASGQVTLIPNGVDCETFAPRRDPLPEKPRRALVFVSGARHARHVDAVREACRRVGLPLDEAGPAVGRPVAAPQELLPRYDLVFTKARGALEAMAVGCAVILVGPDGLGSIVRPEAFDEQRRWNFGRGLLREGDYGPEALVEDIRAYDAEAARQLQARVRTECGLEPMIDAYLGLYEELLAHPPPASSGLPVAWLGRFAHHAAEWSQPFSDHLPASRRPTRPRRGLLDRSWRAVRRWRRRRRHRRALQAERRTT